VKVNSTPGITIPPSFSLTLAVLDWEFAKTGPAAADIAQFTADAFLLHHLASPPNAAGGALVSSFLYSYAKAITGDHSDIQVDDPAYTFFKPTSIMSHLSAHASVWGHLVSWAKDDNATGIAGTEITRHTVQKSLEMCLRSSRNEFEGAGTDVQQCAKRLVDVLAEI
jgi:hypothetical protein